MTDEQKAAFINAQVALLNARIAGMIAANLSATSPEIVPYSEKAFEDVVMEYEGTVGHNACLELFHDLKRG